MNKINLVISPSQQRTNTCILGDVEQTHCRVIGNLVYNKLKTDSRLNVYLVPLLNEGTDAKNLNKAIDLSNVFIESNGGVGYHLPLHTDGGYAGHGVSGFYLSDAGKDFGQPIFNEMCKLTPWPDMQFRKRTDLGELKRTIAVTALIEMSFHDQKIEAEFIHNKAKDIADALVRGIYASLKLSTVSIVPFTYDLIHVSYIDPMALMFTKTACKMSFTDIVKQYHNAMNFMFFGTNKQYPGKILTVGTSVSEGNVISEVLEWDKKIKRGTIIVYKDKTVEVAQIAELKKERDISKIWFSVQAVGLNPINLKAEGQPDSIGRSTNRTALGYNPKLKKALSVYSPANDLAGIRQIMINLGCVDDKGNVLSLGGDSATPCAYAVNGVAKHVPGEALDNFVYWR